MAVIRTRFLFWLIKAYVKKWGKLFLIFFILGLAIFFLLLRSYPIIIKYIPAERKTVIGISGTYTSDNIPEIIINKVAKGLTKVNPDGTVKPDLAASWDIQDKGKTYRFHLKKGLYFTDGTPLIAKNIQYSYTDVSIDRPDDYTMIFHLKDEYSPFLVVMAKPILYHGAIGVSEYKINNIDLNGNFIKSIQLLSTKDKFKTENYIFYPSSDALKIAFALGEVSEAIGLSDTTVNNTSLTSFPNVDLKKVMNYQRLVTLFYNTEDAVLSDKKWRNALSYALPDEFPQGERVYNPYPPTSNYYNISLSDKRQDFNHAKLLLNSAEGAASGSATQTIHIKTLSKYVNTAEVIKKNWKKIGVQSTIEEVDTIPQSFQVYLGDFSVPKDPDQYTLWHSNQQNNITRFQNLRIDKLLEDGRRNVNPDERLKIYNDFQKYLLDESPASFLYFPYEYDVRRK